MPRLPCYKGGMSANSKPFSDLTLKHNKESTENLDRILSEPAQNHQKQTPFSRSFQLANKALELLSASRQISVRDSAIYIIAGQSRRIRIQKRIIQSLKLQLESDPKELKYKSDLNVRRWSTRIKNLELNKLNEELRKKHSKLIAETLEQQREIRNLKYKLKESEKSK